MIETHVSFFHLQHKSENRHKMQCVLHMIQENFDIFGYYGVEEYLCSDLLAIDSKYQGRGIGTQFLEIIKTMCYDFGIKLISALLTSDFSNHNAYQAGYKVDRKLKYAFDRVHGVPSSLIST